MKQYIDKSALVAEIERKMNLCKQILLRSQTRQDDDYHQGNIEAYEVVISLLDTLEVIDVNEEPASNDLEEAVNAYIGYAPEVDECSSVYGERQAFKAGAEWQKEQMITKACNYLFSHMGLFVTFINDDIVEDIESCEFIKKFRIAMEDNYETSGH